MPATRLATVTPATSQWEALGVSLTIRQLEMLVAVVSYERTVRDKLRVRTLFQFLKPGDQAGFDRMARLEAFGVLQPFDEEDARARRVMFIRSTPLGRSIVERLRGS